VTTGTAGEPRRHDVCVGRQLDNGGTLTFGAPFRDIDSWSRQRSGWFGRHAEDPKRVQLFELLKKEHFLACAIVADCFTEGVGFVAYTFHKNAVLRRVFRRDREFVPEASDAREAFGGLLDLGGVGHGTTV
jgi:hypothetical protein